MAATKDRAGKASHGAKTGFILAQAADVPAKEVVARAKRAGLLFAQSYVYKVRGRTDEPTAKVSNVPSPAAPRPTATTTALRLSSQDPHEQSILNALDAIGLTRARAVIDSYEKLIGHATVGVARLTASRPTTAKAPPPAKVKAKRAPRSVASPAPATRKAPTKRRSDTPSAQRRANRKAERAAHIAAEIERQNQELRALSAVNVNGEQTSASSQGETPSVDMPN